MPFGNGCVYYAQQFFHRFCFGKFILVDYLKIALLISPGKARPKIKKTM
jgi:hypothetical protein